MRQFACVYIHRDGSPTIVVTMHQNQDGIWFEDEAPVILEGPLAAPELGQKVLDAMQTTTRAHKDTRGQRLSTWPAFRFSKAGSVRQFEQSFIRITVQAVNDANLVAVIEGWPEKDFQLRVTSSASLPGDAEGIGGRVVSVLQACRDRRL